MSRRQSFLLSTRRSRSLSLPLLTPFSFLLPSLRSIAAKFGVTKGVTAPSSRGGLISGLSFVFSTSAATPLSPGAILQEVAALHVTVGHGGSPYSISTQISMLRKLLLGKTPDEEGWWEKAASGELPLVVAVEKADIIARLLVVKKEIEFATGKTLKLVISGGTEAHLVRRVASPPRLCVLVPDAVLCLFGRLPLTSPPPLSASS